MNTTGARLLRPRWVLPIRPAGVALTEHGVVIVNDRIEAIAPAEQLRARYPQATEISLPDHILMPGLINLHAHSAMTLLRGLADDLPLMRWLQDYIWPAEGRHVSDEFVFDGTQLAMAEMLRGGTTTVNDMYFFHDAVARAGLASGMRTVVGASILEFPTPFASSADDYIAKALAARDRWQDESLIDVILAPHAPYTVSDATFRRVVTLSEQLGCGVHCHIHESVDEINQSMTQHGVRPIERLRHLGLLGPNLIAAHVVHTTETEQETLARHNVNIAHNPASNLKLASGLAPIQRYLQAGINVGIGTDGAASNNGLDLLGDIRLAALLAKAVANDATALPAFQALEMATIGGAMALGKSDQIGSIEVGKQADLVAFDLSAIETQPCFDPISQLVYAASRRQATHVWVNGRCLMEKGELTTLNLTQIIAKARWWRDKIAKTSSGQE